MKWVLLLFAIVSAPALADSSPRESLIGTWVLPEEGHQTEMTFSEDGTFRGAVTSENKALWSFAGTWALSEQAINYTYTESSLERIPVGTTDRDELVLVTEKSLVLKNRANRTVIYSRAVSND